MLHYALRFKFSSQYCINSTNVMMVTCFAMLLLAASTCSVWGQLNSELVSCYTDNGCLSIPIALTTRQCCVDTPDGTTFSVEGSDTCESCVVFGFFQPTFTAAEQGQGYAIPVGYLKRPQTAAVDLAFTISQELLGTTTPGDFTLQTTVATVHVLLNQTNLRVAFTFHVDSIAQELDEPIRLHLTVSQEVLDRFDGQFNNSVFFLDTADLVIVDSDILKLLFTENEYRSVESNLIMPVRVSKIQTIATPVTVRITPVTLTQHRAIGRADPPGTLEDDPYSPIEADLNDFDNSAIVVTFQPDETGQHIYTLDAPVSIVNDTINEASEQDFVVSLEIIDATDESSISISRKDALCRIIDDDDTAIAIGFQQPSYTFTEPTDPLGEAIVGVVLLEKENNVLSEQTFQIVVTVTQNTPSQDILPAQLQSMEYDGDYTIEANNSIVLTMKPDDQVTEFNFRLFGDDLIEGTEAFQAISARLEGSPEYLSPTLLSPNTFIVIEDVDAIVIGFERDRYVVAESVGIVEVCAVVLSGEFFYYPIFIGLNTIQGTADETDYIGIVEFFPILLIGIYSRRQCFSLFIINDELEEDTEMLTVELVFSSIANIFHIGGVVFEPGVAIVEISEIVFGFIDVPYSHYSYEVYENNGTVNLTIGVLSGNLGQEVILSLSTADGTSLNTYGAAISGSDYEGFVDTLLTFGPNKTRTTASIKIINDMTFEISEQFSVSLTLANGSDSIRGVNLDSFERNVTILNDDELMFEFVEERYTVNEDIGTAVLNVHFVFGSIEFYNLSVMVSTVYGSAFGTGHSGRLEGDFTSLHQSFLEFTNDERMASIGVVIEDDNITENREHFSVQLVDVKLIEGDESFLLYDEEKELVTLDETTVIIMDNDRAMLGFLEQTDHNVIESRGNVTFRIGVRGDGQMGFNVPLTFTTISDRNDTTDNTTTNIALADKDYTFETHNLSLTGTESIAITVTILDDDEVETTETFYGMLSAIGTLSSQVMLYPTLSTVNIMDDDYVIGFEDTEVTVNEGEGIVRLVVKVQLGIPSRDVPLMLHTEDGTAKAMNDYSPIDPLDPRNLTFLQCASASEMEVAIQIINDGLYERNETFIGVLRHANASQVRLEPAQVTVHIINNDPAVIGFVHDSNIYDVAEGTNRYVEIVVGVLNGTQLEREVIVRLDTINDTAFSGVDYVAVIGRHLTFDGTTTSHVVSVPLLDDKIDEEQKTFNVNLELVYSTEGDITLSPRLAQILINNTNSSLKVRPHIQVGKRVKPNHMLEYSVGISNNFCLENFTKDVNFIIRCDSKRSSVLLPSVQWLYDDDGDSVNELVNSESNILQIENSGFTSESGEFSSRLLFGPASLLEISELILTENSSMVMFTCILMNDFGSDNQSIQITECAPEVCQDGVTNNCTDICSRETDGTHICSCSEGFTLETDNETCTVIDCGELMAPVNGTVTYSPSDSTTYNSTANYDCNYGFGLEPLENQIRTCQGNGQWSGGDVYCNECKEGYRGDGIICHDVNECNESIHDCIDREHCNNTVGNYTCTCPRGFELNDDGRSCQVHQGILATVVIVGLLMLLVMIALVVLTCQKYRTIKKRNGIKQREILEINNLYVGGKATRLSQFTVQSSKELVQDIHKEMLIYSSNLKIQETIGHGEFGVVYKGKLLKDLGQTVVGIVAIKTLKGFFDELQVDNLLKECLKMQQFDHPNVLKLAGVCMDGGPTPFLVMPFMANGSLHSYLKKERSNLLISPDKENGEVAGVALKRLLDMCLQVARGMEYLTSERIIHRDLAARNCMIDVNFVIKVADFGLAEQLESKDYFRLDKSGDIKLPVKWLALESLVDSVFSEKTDVWAYGVTCWEIFSGGKVPYPSVNPSELLCKLESGYRIEKPNNLACSDEIYSVMLECWNSDPTVRPTFSQLVERLSFYLESMAGYLDIGAFSNQKLPAMQIEVVEEQI